MSSPEGLSPMPIENFAGPILLAYLFTWGLQGVLTVQMYNYYIAFPKDVLRYKILLYGIYALEAAQTFIVTYDAFHTFAVEFGKPNSLMQVRMTWFTVPVVGGIVGCVAKLFYAYRISILMQSWKVGSLIALVSLTSSTAAIISGVLIFKRGSLAGLSEGGIFSTTSLWLSGSALSDLMITIFMTYYLTTRRTVFRRTRLLINKVLRVTIETNLVTAIIATITLALYLHIRKKPYHATGSSSLSKLYANTLFVIFNDRMRIIGGRYSNATEEGEVESFIWRDPHGEPSQGTEGHGREMTVDIRATIDRERQQVATVLSGINVRTEVWTDACHPQAKSEGHDGHDDRSLVDSFKHKHHQGHKAVRILESI